MAGGRGATPAPRSAISLPGFAGRRSKCDMRSDKSSSWLDRLGERILLSLSRDPSAPDYSGGTIKTTVDNSLDFLSLTVPEFRSRFVGNSRFLVFDSPRVPQPFCG